MKKLSIFILILFLSSPAWATIYRIGSDVSDDYATYTLFRVAHTEAAGDTVSFRRGETFRGEITVPASGSAIGGYITYTAHGSGAKPKILGGTNLSSSLLWTDATGNKWYATETLDVGNLIFNNEASVGVKKDSLVGITAQGDFYWDDATDRVYLYSTSNPGTFYTSIESTLKQFCINPIGRNYIIIENLDLRYGNFGVGTYESE